MPYLTLTETSGLPSYNYSLRLVALCDETL